MTIKSIGFAAASALLGSSALALPVAYSEAVSGDLPSVGSGIPTFAFDIGVNTVTGTETGTPYDGDAYRFTIPTGDQVLSAQVTAVDVSGDVVSAGWNFNQIVNSTSVDLGGITVASPGTTILPSLPLSAGFYNLSPSLFQWVTNPGTAGYTFSFTVTPAPEPTSLGLLAAGGLMLRRRSRA